MSIKILLADDHQIVRAGVRSMLEKHKDMEVVGEAENGREAVKLVRKLLPDVVVIDVTMPGLNGIEATRQIIGEYPFVKVVALSMYSNNEFVSGILEAGATAYLLKGCTIEELTCAIRSVVAEKAYLSPEVSHVVIKNYVDRSSSSAEDDSSSLTSREREVLQLLAEGKSSKEIAFTLNVSLKTVEAHRYHIMSKLDIHNVAELTKYAIREGLTSLED